MAESIFDGPVAGNIPNEGLQNDALSGNPEYEQLQALVQKDPSFAQTQEYKDFIANLQSGSGEADDEDQEDDDSGNQPPAQKTGTELNGEEGNEEEEEEEDDDIFGVTKKKEKPKSEVKINFEPPKEMLSFLQENFGVKDAQTFFNSVQTWRTQAQEGAKVKEDHESVMADLAALPPELKKSIHLWANNEDYTSPFSEVERLDWSESFESQDKGRLVQHFLPEVYEELQSQLDNGDIDESEFEKQVVLLAKSTKAQFNESKKALESSREEYVERIEREQKEFKKSALTSVEALSKAYPNFKKSEIAKIRSFLVEGKLEDVFFDKNGNYKEDAAIKFAFSLYGDKMVDTLIKKGERRGESRVNRNIVDNSPTTLRNNRTVDTAQLSSEEQQAIAHLMGGPRTGSIFD
jgi:hypothetical protein